MARWFRGSYFRMLLAWFIAIGVLPALLAGLVSIRLVNTTLGDNAVRQTADSLARIASDVDQLIDEYESILRSIAQDPDIQGMLTADRDDAFYAAKYKLHLTMAGKSGLAAAHVADIDTEAAISTLDVPRSYRYPFNKNWRVFRKVERSGDFAIQMGDRSLTALPDVVMTLCKRVVDLDGKLVGYAIIDVFASSLRAIIKDKALFYNADLYLADNLDYLIYASDGAAVAPLARIPEPLAILRAESAREQTINGRAFALHMGKELGLVETEAARGEARLYLTVPMGAIAQDTASIRAIVMSVVVSCLLLSVLVALIVARNISNPVKELSRAMRRIERGDYGARVDFDRQDEIGALGRSFNEMSARIRTLLDNIEEKQRRLQWTESKALQAQINPHFLYNALDAIKWSAKMGDIDNVPRITVRLGRLLRSIANTKEDVICVGQELDLVSDYLSIQQIRYGDRLEYAIDVSEEIRALRVPKLIIEPIVENAVVHGVENTPGVGRIDIGAARAGDFVEFTVRDNGPGIPPALLARLNHPDAGERGGNIGLINVDARAKLYGDADCGIRIDSRQGVGTTVILRVRAL